VQYIRIHQLNKVKFELFQQKKLTTTFINSINYNMSSEKVWGDYPTYYKQPIRVCIRKNG